MNSLQINKALERCEWTRHSFLGSFAADRIPSPVQRRSHPYCMVVNTDTAREAGTHWLAVYVQTPTVVDFFDSFADWPPTSDGIIAFLRHFTHINRSHTCLQSDRSSMCGPHVIHFLCRRCQGWTLAQIVAHLVHCKTPADRMVAAFTRKIIFDDNE